MRCPICRHGGTQPGAVTVTLQRGEATIIVKGVPAEVCEDCGEYCLAEEVARRVLELAEEAVGRGVEVGILRYAA